MERYITRVHPHYGALHKHMGIPIGTKIPTQLLRQIVNVPEGTKVSGVLVTPKIKRQALFALNVRK